MAEKSTPQENATATMAVLTEMVKETFGENYTVIIRETGEGVFELNVSMLILSKQPILEGTFKLPRQEIAMRMNDKMYNALSELAEMALWLSNDIRSKLK